MLEKLSQFLRRLLALLAYVGRFFTGHEAPHACQPCPPALKRPDPFIYSQSYLTSLGYPVTWDNPDIFLFQGSSLVDPHDLKANTPYTVVARVWNASVDVPVVGLAVRFSYLSFGMGTQSHAIGTSFTDLNAKGLPGCPAFAYTTWTTPAQLGHYCLQALLEPPDDSNWLNNLGQRNTDVAQPQSPAVFKFTVGNHVGPRSRRVRFTVDSYVIPPLARCGESDVSATRQREVAKVPPPVPEGWIVALAPSELEIDPGEEKPVQAAITAPPEFAGEMLFNVTAYDDVGCIGGVTLQVEVI